MQNALQFYALWWLCSIAVENGYLLQLFQGVCIL